MVRLVGRGAVIALLALAACDRSSIEVTPLASPAGGVDAGDAALALAPDSSTVFFAWVAGDTGSRHLWVARSADAGDEWPLRRLAKGHLLEGSQLLERDHAGVEKFCR